MGILDAGLCSGTIDRVDAPALPRCLAIDPRDNPTQSTLVRLLNWFGLRLLSLAPAESVNGDCACGKIDAAPRVQGIRRQDPSGGMDEVVAEIVPDTQP